MNAFDEFAEVARRLAGANIPYALVGGVALAFHGHPRFTRDIDLLLKTGDLEAVSRVLEQLGYRSYVPPWALGNHGITLHRWIKPTPDDEIILDLMEARLPAWQQMIDRAEVAEGPEGPVRVATARDLITLKRLRYSKQDAADIEKLDPPA